MVDVVLIMTWQEAVRYHNQTTLQLQMLEFAKQKLLSDDEVRDEHGIFECLLNIHKHEGVFQIFVVLNAFSVSFGHLGASYAY